MLLVELNDGFDGFAAARARAAQHCNHCPLHSTSLPAQVSHAIRPVRGRRVRACIASGHGQAGGCSRRTGRSRGAAAALHQLLHQQVLQHAPGLPNAPSAARRPAAAWWHNAREVPTKPNGARQSKKTAHSKAQPKQAVMHARCIHTHVLSLLQQRLEFSVLCNDSEVQASMSCVQPPPPPLLPAVVHTSRGLLLLLLLLLATPCQDEPPSSHQQQQDGCQQEAAQRTQQPAGMGRCIAAGRWVHQADLPPQSRGAGTGRRCGGT